MTCPARAIIDLAALRDNVRFVASRARGAAVMAMVKADAYGHGLVPCARAALDAGASWLGVAQLAEAFALREALGGVHQTTGGDVRILAGNPAPGAPFARAIRADVDLTAGAEWTLRDIAVAAREVGRAARIHLKVDTGMGRGGGTATEWDGLFAATARLVADGTVELAGIYSHFACADEPGHPSIAAQQQAFTAALALAERHGLHPETRHLANSAAVLTGLDACYDLVRPGIALYGLAPNPGVVDADELVAAMTLEGDLTLVKQVEAGQGVSYGLTYVTDRPTRLGLVPLGYGDGIARSASNRAEVLVAGARARIAGRVCMDQFVVDLGLRSSAQAGDRVVLFGRPERGEPGAAEWAAASGTIDYEVVTRIGPRVERVYVGGTA